MVNQSNAKPIIFAHDGPLKGETWAINSEMLIGREADCDIVILDRQVSRQHAKIEISKNGQVAISDLNSKNGVFINGERISGSRELSDGDAIKIALIQEMFFVSSDATIPLDVKIPETKDEAPYLYIEEVARRIWLGDEELLPPLSVQQYNLLTLLYHSNNSVVMREEIINAVWGDDAAVGVSEQALDALVRRLRSRLHKKDPTHAYITTVRGVGFLFKNVFLEN